MTSFPDPDRDGGYRFRAINDKGATALFGLDPSTHPGGPKTFVVVPTSLGFEFRFPNGNPIATIQTDGRSNLVQVPQLQLVFPPNPPAPYTVDADPTKNIIAAVMAAPISINLPTTVGGLGYAYYILPVDPFGPPAGAPLTFNLTINTFAGNTEPVNLTPGPKIVTTNFAMSQWIAPGSGGWGAFTWPLLP